MTTTKSPSEHVIQRQAVQWIRQWTPYVVFAIPNGGKRGEREAMKLKAEGVLAGVPDLQIPALGLFLEMKTPTGALSAVQIDVIARLRAEGHIVEVCRSVDDVIDVVTAQMAKRGQVPEVQPIRKVVKK